MTLRELRYTWINAGCTWRGFFQYLQVRLAYWIGGKALLDEMDEFGRAVARNPDLFPEYRDHV